MPESKRHLMLRTYLFQLLSFHFSDQACIGSDQFVYWNARDPRRCLAPDVFLRHGMRDDLFASWKTWERGTPQLAVEITSESDQRGPAWEEKLERYHELGVEELVRFDLDAPAGQRLRVWNRTGNDLVERVVDGESSPLVLLGLHWVVIEDEHTGLTLRLARDAEGRQLLLTREETEAQARLAAEQRVAELEEELRRRGG